jgi:hypothetical protein
MLNKRNSLRRKMVLPVKISVDNASHVVHTVDITAAGARLASLRVELQPGAIIMLQRGVKKAEFRVHWIRPLGPSELQAGIESVVPLRDNFWGVDLSDAVESKKKETKTLLTLLSDRSK